MSKLLFHSLFSKITKIISHNMPFVIRHFIKCFTIIFELFQKYTFYIASYT